MKDGLFSEKSTLSKNYRLDFLNSLSNLSGLGATQVNCQKANRFKVPFL